MRSRASCPSNPSSWRSTTSLRSPNRRPCTHRQKFNSALPAARAAGAPAAPLNKASPRRLKRSRTANKVHHPKFQSFNKRTTQSTMKLSNYNRTRRTTMMNISISKCKIRKCLMSRRTQSCPMLPCWEPRGTTREVRTNAHCFRESSQVRSDQVQHVRGAWRSESRPKRSRTASLCRLCQT